MPVVEQTDRIEIPEDAIRVDVFRSSGPGGQSVNTTDSAVRVTHLPSNMVVTCQDEKSQLKNKAKALKILRARLLERAQAEQQAEIAASRKSMVGTGDRSERIRTYNFPQSRVSDHRINLTLHSLDNQAIAEAALAECQVKGFHTSVVVVDRAGQMLVLLRDEQASSQTAEMARRKAYTARMFRISSAEFQKRTAGDVPYSAQRNVADVLALAGGVPIKVGEDTIREFTRVPLCEEFPKEPGQRSCAGDRGGGGAAAGLAVDVDAVGTRPEPSPRTRSTNEPRTVSVWITAPAFRTSPTLSGCQTLLPVVYRAAPLIRTILALPCVTF
jgi:uncharacterized protein GlcG (DUF336 family)